MQRWSAINVRHSYLTVPNSVTPVQSASKIQPPIWMGIGLVIAVAGFIAWNFVGKQASNTATASSESSPSPVPATAKSKTGIAAASAATIAPIRPVSPQEILQKVGSGVSWRRDALLPRLLREYHQSSVCGFRQRSSSCNHHVHFLSTPHSCSYGLQRLQPGEQNQEGTRSVLECTESHPPPKENLTV